MDIDDEICEGCSVLDINKLIPLDVGVYIYGFLMPVFISIMCVSNSFIILVLSQKHLRTPTNNILLAMAILDLLTGLIPLPWQVVCKSDPILSELLFLFYYTLGGYKNVELTHSILCQYPYLSNILPTMFHTSVIWLTVFLAIQRYIYVCLPSSIHHFCTPKITKTFIVFIIFCSISTALPEFLGKSFEQVKIGGRNTCILRYTSLVLDILGIEAFYSIKYWTRFTFVHILPCVLLTIFTYKLSRTIRKTEVRKRSLVILHGDQQQGPAFKDNSSSTSTGSSRRSLYTTNRMLTAICILFLLIEVPAAVVFSTHFIIAKHLDFLQTQNAYYLLNIALIIRNFLIILVSPIQFSIYCCMSEHYRLTARQLFSSKLLFVTQAQASFHGGRRYSLVLVDVDSISQKRFSFRRKSSKSSVRNQPTVPQIRQKNRQVISLCRTALCIGFCLLWRLSPI